jgi:hypothetical protein
MASIPNLPQPQSQPEILQDMLSSYAASTGINSPFVGSANLSFFQVISLAIARASGDVFSTLLNSSLQYATGSNLQAIATEFGIIPVESAVSTGAVTVTDTSFQKVSTSIYPGANSVNVGSTVIYVGSVKGFPNSGSIYIGRGTNDSEGPIGYSSTAPIGNYFQINLTSATTRYHNIGESVILAQGGVRTVPVNTVVIAPSTGLSPNIQYLVTQQASILDGEVTVSNVPVTALIPGSSGNVPIGAISQFAATPFSGATVSNPASTSGGTDPETDDQLRTQIQNVLSSIGLGTATAIENSLIGVSATDEAATIASDSLVSNLDGSSTVYIDTGGSVPYEAKTAGVAIEHIVDSAVGGEKFFQLATGGTQAPVAKAFLQSTDASPFSVNGGMVLAVTVGGITTQHTFQNSDFIAPGAATAYEICASINGDSSLNFEATTAGSGTYVVLRSVAEAHESIQVTVPSSPNLVNANNFLGFPSTLNETLRLYKNDVLLSEDGNTASVLTQPQTLWSNSIDNGDTLILSVDGTQAITYIILNADFIATGLYTTVSATNSLASWVEVFNNKLTGVTATIVGTQIELTSNLEQNNRAQVVIDPSSTLVTKSMFGHTEPLSSQGSVADYVLDRNTAQFELATALAAGDTLLAGTQNTKGTITSSAITGGTINFSSEGYIWLLIDAQASFINTGVTSGSFLTVSSSGNTVSYVSNVASSFANVNPGDYLIVWSPQLNSANRLEARVHSVTTTTLSNDTLNIVVTSAEAAAVVPQANIPIFAGFVIARTESAPQKFDVQSGIQTIDNVVIYLQSQTDSLTFSTSLEEFIIISTKTLNTNGSVTVITSDSQGALLGFTQGQTNVSSYPILAYQDTAGSYLPAFFHSKVSADTFASPPDSFVTSFTSAISLSGRNPDEIVTFINPYGTIDDEQPEGEVVQETSVSGTAVGITQDPDIRRIRTNDRYFLSSSLSFGNNDLMTVVIDNNPNTYTFSVPLARAALTNTSYGVDANNFNAYDEDFAPTGSFATSFGSAFSFSNYEVLMQAKKVLSSTTQQSSVLYRSTKWGRTGEEIVVSYIYNGAAVSITNSISIGSTINVTITVPPSTSAGVVATYVNTNLSQYITAAVVDDGSGGSPGSGFITANASTQLLDGINWLASSNVSGSPQFTFKNPLSLPSDVGYAFNNGETVLFAPTTFDQVNRYMNVLPVTGLTTASIVNGANRDSSVEISSDTFGSNGYVDVVGGSANGYSFPVLNSALNIGNSFAAISANNIASSNVLSDQWFRLQASTVQQKDTSFGANTDVTIVPNSPIAGQSTITLTGRTLTQLYFGTPRTIAGLSGLNFRVEQQGSLVCFSYVNSTGSPQFLTFPVNFNSTTGDTFSVTLVGGSNDSQYTILSGTTTFSGLSIGDLVTIDVTGSPANSGTFMVSGISASVLQVTNPSAVPVASSTVTAGTTFVATTGVMEGDSVVIASPFSASNQGTYRVIRVFNDSFWIENVDFIEEQVTLSSSSFTFYAYESTIHGDSLVISGTAFGPDSPGSHTIVTVVNQNEIVVNGVLDSVVSLNLNGLLSSFYVNEGVVYSGYKQVYLIASQPGAPTLNEILFNTLAQYEKINQSAGVQVNSLGKLEFSTEISEGLDGYKFNSGLIQQANRTVYGDPTDPLSFPGVSAAGSDIFIREPLALVVNLAIEVRLQTGTPFSAVSEQVRSNVAALVSSNPVGQSIALSSIVAACVVIPGVISVVISSPLYDITHDLIVVQPSEKTFILDPSTNISVSVIT